MAVFDGMNNPWAPGGQMSPRMPWAQPGLNYGWGHGNEFFTPKTKEQIRDEGLLQMAVLAAILVAPALVGAAGGAGGAAAASGGAGGAAAESAGAALVQGAGAAAGSAGAGAVMGAGAWASIAGGAATAAILRPFLQPDSSQALLQAARMGEAELSRELQRRYKKDCDCSPEPRFATEEWERKYGDCWCRDGNAKIAFQYNVSKSVLRGLLDAIGQQPWLERGIRFAINNNPRLPVLPVEVASQVQSIIEGVASDFESTWEKSRFHSDMMLSSAGEELDKAWEKGNQIDLFRKLAKKAGITSENYRTEILLGKETSMNPANGKITVVFSKVADEILVDLAHELTNRIYRKRLQQLVIDVGSGKITPAEYANEVISIESIGTYNTVKIAAEVEGYSFVYYLGESGKQMDELVMKYQSGELSDNEVRDVIRISTRNFIVADTGEPAFEYYRRRGQEFYDFRHRR
ncbi:MAG: hypothetical protein U0176_05965 [Bacteroidia bacterium]